MITAGVAGGKGGPAHPGAIAAPMGRKEPSMEQPRVADLGEVEVMVSLVEWDLADMPTIPDMGQVMAGLDWAAHAMVNLAMAGFEFEEVR